MASTDDEKAGGGKGKATSSGQPPGTRARASAAANALLERGLQMYGDGDLLGAITEWEAALTIDPGLARAREYVEYVRANYDALSQQFDAVRDAERAAEADGVPVRDVPDDPDAYDSLDVEMTVGEPDDDRGDELEDGLAALDAGLDDAIGAVADTLPPLGAPRRASAPHAAAHERDDESHDDHGDESPPAVELEAMAPDEDLPGMAPELEDPLPEHGDDGPDNEDEATIDVRMHQLLQRSQSAEDRSSPPAPTRDRPGIMTIQPRGASFSMPGLDTSSYLPPSREIHDVDEDAHTTLKEPGAPSGIRVPPRRAPAHESRPPSRPSQPLGPLDIDDDDIPRLDEDDDLFATATRERPAFPGISGTEKRREDSSVIVDDRLLRGAGVLPAGPRGADLERTIEYKPRRETGGREARAATITRRVSDLLEQAQAAADRGKFVDAVLAVEEAGQCDEDGTVAPVLLHRHRDLLYRIYEGHLGDMNAVPLVAVPMHEIAAQNLDHRTGFLLSRIDGMLTFEDILDVAGMPRMEAYQILSSLLRKGVIEVR